VPRGVVPALIAVRAPVGAVRALSAHPDAADRMTDHPQTVGLSIRFGGVGPYAA
jgi:hypothetical protein